MLCRLSGTLFAGIKNQQLVALNVEYEFAKSFGKRRGQPPVQLGVSLQQVVQTAAPHGLELTYQ